MTPLILTLIDLFGATVAIVVAYTIGVNRGHRTCLVCATRRRRAAALRQAGHRARGSVTPEPLPGEGPPPGVYDVVWSEQNETLDDAHRIRQVELAPTLRPGPGLTVMMSRDRLAQLETDQRLTRTPLRRVK